MSKGDRYLSSMLFAGTALAALPAFAGELPSGASVVHGQVDIASPSAKAMTIRQGSESAIVNWRDFSIGQGARVDIRQPSARSALLNRVTGDTPSTISGQLNANGKVFLVNPNGIVISPTGTVNAGSFVASTLGTSDDDFLAGRHLFAGTGASAAVINRGRIAVARHGVAALLGGRAENAGTIEANLGRVGLASGERATLDFTGDGFLTVAVPTADDGDAAPLVEMSGRITADGGRVALSAAAARDAARRTVNLSGVVEARTVGGRSGDVILGGGGGAVTVSGRIDVRAPARTALAAAEPPARRAKGGGISVRGETVALAGATLDASGTGGGGTVRIGGDWHGAGTAPRATKTTIDAASSVAADALTSGDGGTVVVWSDEDASFAGGISARGGPQGGNGGSAEVSGKRRLGFSGEVDMSADAGNAGSLLLDPLNTFIELTDGVAPLGVVDAADLEAILGNGTDVTISTVNTDIAEEGNITVGTPLSWGDDSLGGGTLTLFAEGDIIIAQPITADIAGGLTLQAAGAIMTPATWSDSGGVIQTGGNGAINVVTFTLVNGNWTQNAAVLPTFVATDFRRTGGSFLRALGGNGSTAAPYRIADVYGLQGIGSPLLLGSNFVLANTINAAASGGWNNDGDNVLGFDPIGDTAVPFTGSFDGRGFAISGLSMNRADDAGLFALIGPTATVSGVNLTNAAITGVGLVGGVAGRNQGIVTRSSVTGTVTGSELEDFGGRVGGLVGDNVGTISVSFSSAATAFAGSTSGSATGYAGGLAGENSGAISNVYADGTVSSVSGGNLAVAGGLVGLNSGTITGASAVGAVAAASFETNAIAGGLVGVSTGSVSQAYAQGAVTVGGNGGSGGGLIGQNGGSISQTYATGLVSGAEGDDLGGLVGLDSSGGGTSSFWNTDTTGQGSSGVGDRAEGLDDGAFQSASFVTSAQAQGWNFLTTWAPPTDGLYPGLYAIDPVVNVTIPDTTRAYGRPNPDFGRTATVAGGPGVYVFGPANDTLTVPFITDAATRSPVGDYIVIPAGNFAESAGGVEYRTLSDGGTLTVIPATLTITPDDQRKTYGDAFSFRNAEYTLSGLVAGDEVSGITLASGGAPATAGAGTYAITASGAAVTGPENYTIVYGEGDFSVARAALAIRADDQTKPFGTTFRFDGTEFTATGLVNGDQVGTVGLSSLGQPGGASPGAYAIEIGAISDAILANYDVSTSDGRMVVTPPPPATIPRPAFGGPLLPPQDSDPEALTDAFTLPNPPDTVVLAGLTDAGGGGGGAAGGGRIPQAATDAQQGAANMLAYLEQASASLDRTLADCRSARPDTLDYLACIDASLRAYAGRIGERVVELPEPLRKVSAIIEGASLSISATRARAAERIARAGSPEEIQAIERQAATEARDAIQGAAGKIRKQMELIRADDPEVARFEAQQAETIAAALGKVDAGLVRAVEL